MLSLFQFQEELLPPEPAAIATQPAIFVHDAMTWDQDGDAILPIGPADSALGRCRRPRATCSIG